MELRWIGGRTFHIRGDRGQVVCDPSPAALAADDRLGHADIWTFSVPRDASRCRSVGDREPFVIDGPGEYEVQGVFVSGVHVPSSAGGGAADRATAYSLVVDDLSVCHLGALGSAPTQAQLEALGAIDVLIVPVGDPDGVGPAQAVEIVGLVEPTLIVPMQYRTEAEPDLEPVERFLEEMGAAAPEVVASLQATRSRLPAERQVVLLAPAGA